MGPGAQTTLAILAAMVVLLATGLVPAAVAGLLAAGSFLLSGILNVEQPYCAINWTTVILVGAMMLLSVAIQETGAARLLAEGLVTLVGDARAHPHPDLCRDRHADGRLARARAHGGRRGGRGGVPDPGRNAHEPHGDGARLLQVHRLLKNSDCPSCCGSSLSPSSGCRSSRTSDTAGAVQRTMRQRRVGRTRSRTERR
jgi:hypothetical protein